MIFVLSGLSGCAGLPGAERFASPDAPARATGSSQRSSQPPSAGATSAVADADLATPGAAQADPPQKIDSPALAREEPTRELERGIASWYGPGFHGRRTANGERFDMHSLTAAHKTLPFGTRVRVRSLLTGKEVEVRVNDRGPFTKGRVIDLSRAAAEALGLLGLGVKNVLLLVPANTVLGREPKRLAKAQSTGRIAAKPAAASPVLSMR